MSAKTFIPGLALSCVLMAQHQQLPPSERARHTLEQGASDKDPDTRRETALALSLIDVRSSAAPLLASLVQDKDYMVRQAALDSIGELRDRKLAGLAEQALNDDVPEVVFAAARALQRLQDPAGKAALLAILDGEEKAKSGFIRAKLRDTMRRMKTPRSALFFVVQQGVGFVPVPGVGEGVSAMSAMLQDSGFSPRATALLLLASERSPEIRTAMERAFSDDDWSVRATAVQLTIRPENRSWKPRLIPLIDDANKKVRFRAAAVYLRLSPVPSG